MRAPIYLATAALLAAAAAGASTPNTGPKPWDTEEGPAANAVSQTLKCVITEVRADRILEVFDEASRNTYLIQLGERVDLRARDRRLFGGRKKIAFRDLAAGHRIKVTYLTADRSIVRVRVIGRAEVG